MWKNGSDVKASNDDSGAISVMHSALSAPTPPAGVGGLLQIPSSHRILTGPSLIIANYPFFDTKHCLQFGSGCSQHSLVSSNQPAKRRPHQQASGRYPAIRPQLYPLKPAVLYTVGYRPKPVNSGAVAVSNWHPTRGIPFPTVLGNVGRRDDVVYLWRKCCSGYWECRRIDSGTFVREIDTWGDALRNSRKHSKIEL